MAGMIVLDASVLAAHFDNEDAHHSKAEEILLELVSDDLGASPISIAELLVGPARAGKLQTARDALHDLEIQEIPLHDGSAERLAQLRASTGLKLPDCCVLLAAEAAHADGIRTFDARLAKHARHLGGSS